MLSSQPAGKLHGHSQAETDDVGRSTYADYDQQPQVQPLVPFLGPARDFVNLSEKKLILGFFIPKWQQHTLEPVQPDGRHCGHGQVLAEEGQRLDGHAAAQGDQIAAGQDHTEDGEYAQLVDHQGGGLQGDQQVAGAMQFSAPIWG